MSRRMRQGWIIGCVMAWASGAGLFAQSPPGEQEFRIGYRLARAGSFDSSNIQHRAAGKASGASQPIEEANLPTGNGELVLIIDDEQAIREITRETLQAYGYRTVTARDGAQGLAIFAEQMKAIDVVITDLMMPVMDGTDAIVVLRRMHSDVKIIAASGLTPKGEVTTPDNPSVKAFLTKPYTAETLLKTLASVLK